MKTHEYVVDLTWTGVEQSGPARTYEGYSRDHRIDVAGKPPLEGSADPAFRGDASRHNPEDLLVASLSACHMLWYLHLCVTNGIVVTDYRDRATGVMTLEGGGDARVTGAVLRPRVTISAGDSELARALHQEANAKCFIARSVNFPVTHEPEIVPAASA